jgi:hypothetical protein
MNKGFKYWLSWIGVLPISLISGLLVTFPVHWVLFQTLSGGESPFVTPYPKLPEEILQPFFTALVIVWTASQTAPQYKFKTAIIIAILWIIVASGAFVLGYLGYHYERVQFNLKLGGLPIIMGVVGAFVGLFLVKKKLVEEKTKTTKMDWKNTI